MSTKQFYTYKLIDSLTGLPFYVGKGTGDRMYNHEQYYTKIYKTATHNNTMLKNKIRKIIKNSGRVRYQKFRCKTEEQAFLIEKALIHKYGRRDLGTGVLCNMTNGGEGGSGHIHTEHHKDLLRASARMRAMRIDQYSKSGEFIRTWDYYKDIINQLHIDGSGLSRCITNKIKSAGGFRWTKSGVGLLDWNPTYRPRQHMGKVVYQFTQEGKFIASHDSLVAAGKSIGKHANSILECCAGRSRSTGQYVWKYTKEFEGYPSTLFQYNVDGIFITGYVDVMSAAIQTGSTQPQIQNAICNGNKGNGFYWSKTQQEKIKVQPKKTTGKPIMQLTLNGEIVNQFESVRQAVIITKIKGVANCAVGLATTAGGYKWKYVD